MNKQHIQLIKSMKVNPMLNKYNVKQIPTVIYEKTNEDGSVGEENIEASDDEASEGDFR